MKHAAAWTLALVSTSLLGAVPESKAQSAKQFDALCSGTLRNCDTCAEQSHTHKLSIDLVQNRFRRDSLQWTTIHNPKQDPSNIFSGGADISLSIDTFKPSTRDYYAVTRGYDQTRKRYVHGLVFGHKEGGRHYYLSCTEYPFGALWK